MSTDSEQSAVNKKKAGGYSHADEHSIIYEWEINKITSFIKSAQDKTSEEKIDLCSPTFSTDAKIKDLWYLQLTIKNDDKSSTKKSWLSLYLMPENDNRKFRTKYLLFFLNNDKEQIMAGNNPKTDCWLDHIFHLTEGYGRPHYMQIDELLKKKDKLLQNDTLTVGVELIVYDDYVTVNNPINSMEDTERKLQDDFKDLFIAKKRCDVIISVGDMKFDVHKLVLSTRSSVFDAMFSHDMKENKENEVTIPDVDPEIFKKVLDYIYTDQVDELEKFAEELLEVSDKYHLQGLKEKCEASLSKCLAYGNAVRILILADRHNAKRLKELATNYIVTNWANMRNTEQYKQLEKSHPLLDYAVVKKIADGVLNM